MTMQVSWVYPGGLWAHGITKGVPKRKREGKEEKTRGKERKKEDKRQKGKVGDLLDMPLSVAHL